MVAVELVSVDGVMETLEEWTIPYSNGEMEEANAAGCPPLTPCCWGAFGIALMTRRFRE